MFLGLALPWDPRDVPFNPKALDSPLTSPKDSEFRGSGFGFGVPGLGLTFSDWGFRVSGLRFKV